MTLPLKRQIISLFTLMMQGLIFMSRPYDLYKGSCVKHRHPWQDISWLL